MHREMYAMQPDTQRAPGRVSQVYDDEVFMQGEESIEQRFNA
jgi:hypothetical protein